MTHTPPLPKRYTKRPVTIEATQWFKHGDHPQVVALPSDHPIDRHCIDPKAFGWVATLEGGHVVTPGDWIITGVKGEHYPCKPDIFDATYTPEALSLPATEQASAEQEPVGTVTPYNEHRGAQHYKFTPSENCPTDRRFDVYAAPVSQPAPAAPANDADKLLLREMFALCEDTEEKCAGSDDAFKRGRAFEAKGIRRAIGTWYQATFCGPSFMGEPVLEKTAPAPLPGSTTCLRAAIAAKKGGV